MPRGDGTGPMGTGLRTGRRMGICNVVNTDNSKTQKDLLNQQKTVLENRLDLVNKQLDTLKDED